MNVYNDIFTGLALGSVYALIAMGFNILFRPTNIFNLAQGDIVMLASLVAASMVTSDHLPWFVGLVIVVVAIGALAGLEERIAVAPVVRKSASSVGWVISTLAVSLIIENVVVKIWGSNPYTVKAPPLLSVGTHITHGVVWSSFDIFLIVATILLVGIIEAIYRTRPGRAVLAVAEDRDAAKLCGINPRRISLYSFILGGAFAGFVGLIVAPMLNASTSMGQGLLLQGFEAAAVGGIGDNRGALLGGWLIGLCEQFVATQLAPGYGDAVTLGLLLLVLLIRPAGFFGAREARVV